MKSKTKIIALLMAASTIGGIAHAGIGSGSGFGPPPQGSMMDPAQEFVRLSKVLKINDSQLAQIKALLEADRAQMKTVMEQVMDKRDQLREVSEGTSYDETFVRSLAAGIAEAEIEMAVLRTKIQTQINTILTAEQREMLKSLRPEPGRSPFPALQQ
jgi:Spy/CpxP family protein refolding chaperone